MARFSTVFICRVQIVKGNAFLLSCFFLSHEGIFTLVIKKPLVRAIMQNPRVENFLRGNEKESSDLGWLSMKEVYRKITIGESSSLIENKSAKRTESKKQLCSYYYFFSTTLQLLSRGNLEVPCADVQDQK